jgi:ADP-ribose pyrophosphatase
MVFDGSLVNASCVAGVLAVHAVRSGVAQPRPADAPWPDRPTRFAARKA